MEGEDGGVGGGVGDVREELCLVEDILRDGWFMFLNMMAG